MSKERSTPRDVGSHWIHSIEIEPIASTGNTPGDRPAALYCTVVGESQDDGPFALTVGMPVELLREVMHHLNHPS